MDVVVVRETPEMTEAALEVEGKKETPVESSSGETMVWGISLGNWGLIVGKLMILYVFLGLYFTALLYCGFEVRKQDYLRLPSKYFGNFERNFAYNSIITRHHKDPVIYKNNRPKGCEEIVNGGETAVECNSDDSKLWNVFPWVKSSLGLNTMNANCFTEPAYDFVSSVDMQNVYCSNYVLDTSVSG